MSPTSCQTAPPRTRRARILHQRRTTRAITGGSARSLANQSRAQRQQRIRQETQHHHCGRIDHQDQAHARARAPVPAAHPRARNTCTRPRAGSNNAPTTEISTAKIASQTWAAGQQRLDDPQLGPEADEWRHPGGGEHQHQHQRSEQRIARGQALEVGDLIVLEAAAAQASGSCRMAASVVST